MIRLESCYIMGWEVRVMEGVEWTNVTYTHSGDMLSNPTEH
jgi:hypothetical protein